MTSDSSVYLIETWTVGYPSWQHDGVAVTWCHGRMHFQLLLFLAVH